MSGQSGSAYGMVKLSGKFYKLLQPISGDINLAKYTPSGDRLALRRTNLERVKRLEWMADEAALNRLLRHPNVVPFLGNFVVGAELWTVTPFYEYGSAGDLSAPTGMPEELIAFVVRDTLAALDYLHGRGIIHRSVRGSHILVANSGRSMLSGLKYATSVTADGRWATAVHEYESSAAVNVNWLAPEVLEQNLLGYNFKSDIYSLGITCCELANGCPPFANLDPTEMFIDKLSGNFPRPLDSTCEEIFKMSPSDLSPEERKKFNVYKSRSFSKSFHKFTIDHCLNFDPHERPTASQLLDHSFIRKTRKAFSCSKLSALIKQSKPLLQNLYAINRVAADKSDASKSGLSGEQFEWNLSH